MRSYPFVFTSTDDRYYSYYAYDHTGQRTLKMTGDASTVDLNAQLQQIVSGLNRVTIYPSPYLVLTEQGYTKHYYAGADRVCARLGSGGLDHDTACISRNEEVSTRVENLFWHGLKLVDAKEFKPEIIKELQLVDANGKELDWLKNVDIEKLLMRLQISVKPDPWSIHKIIDDLVRERPDEEPDVYYYHSDHLGGASWITDDSGIPVQHLQYLPFGEPFVDQHPAGYQERYTFTAKERDRETGYSYFGARYMDHELMTMWLSVDPMMDKYPNISPYNYCMWNPIRLVDPNGMDTVVFDGAGNFSNRIKASGKHIGRVLDKNGNKRFDFEFVCQQDADRCCSPGSPEEVDIRFRDRLSHGKDCPAEEQSPIYQIEFVWQKEIISQLKESGACDKSFFPRWGYAFSESDGGKIDFDDINRRNGNWNDHTLYIPMVPGKKYAHNASNLGNFLWGAAMYKMGINIKDAIIGANLHALWSHWELDSSDDRLSILLGYNYSIKQSGAR